MEKNKKIFQMTRFNHTMIFFKLTQKDHSAIEMHRLKNIVIFSYFHFFLTKLFLIHSQHFRKFARFQMLLNSPPSIFNFYRQLFVILILLDVKGPLLGLRQFLAAEIPLRMMRSAFLSHSKSFFHSSFHA